MRFDAGGLGERGWDRWWRHAGNFVTVAPSSTTPRQHHSASTQALIKPHPQNTTHPRSPIFSSSCRAESSESGDLRQSEGFREQMKHKAEGQPRNELGQFVSQGESAGGSGGSGVSMSGGIGEDRFKASSQSSSMGRDEQGRFTSKHQ
jgi:hypothetical protein